MVNEKPHHEDHSAEREGESSDTGEMNFLEHLEELRRTILYCIITLVVACGLVLGFIKVFAGILNWPLQFALGDEVEIVQLNSFSAEGEVQAHSGTAIEDTSEAGRRRFGLITTSPMAVFSVILQVSFLGGVALAMPFILYFVARFVAPGLTKTELSVLRPGCTAAFALFLSGSAFSYAILVPASLKASIFFNELFGFQVLWSADRYYGLLVWMTVGIGISFEFPLLLVILVYIGILNVAKLKHFRPYSVVAFLVVAAVVTPTTDPFTFLLLAVPMSLLYEASILISQRVEKLRNSVDEKEGV